MYKLCPNCGSRIVYSYGNSYYLRCNRSYSCWHQHCSEDDTKEYDLYINKETSIAYDMRDKILKDDCDYYYDDNS